MKKVLFVASTLSHIENFHVAYLKEFKEQGYSVHVMGKLNNKSEILYADKIISIPFEKNMLSLKNFALSFKIAKIIKEENYDIITLHTSLAAFFSRLGIMLCLKKPKLIINTVHGYLFDYNSSLLKRCIMLLAEKLTKCVTNVIITMNSLDYDIAKRYKLYKDNLYLTNGMGINLSLFPPVSYKDKITLRAKYNFSKDDFILIYVAEFSKRKNQKFLLDSINKLVNDGFTNIKLLLLGDGQFLDELKVYAQTLGISNNALFVGYSKNTCTYYQLSDICVSSSRIEGLPFNIMEAMSTGLPVIASKVKGHTDLINSNENGFLFEYDNIDEFCLHVKNIYCNKDLHHKMSLKSVELVKKYSIDVVLPKTISIILNKHKSHS